MTEPLFRIKIKDNGESSKAEFRDADRKFVLERLLMIYKNISVVETTHYSFLQIHMSHAELQNKKEVVKVSMDNEGNFYRNPAGDINVTIPRESPIINNAFFEKTFKLQKVVKNTFDAERGMYDIVYSKTFDLYELNANMITTICKYDLQHGSNIKIVSNSGFLHAERDEEGYPIDDESEDYFTLYLEFGEW